MKTNNRNNSFANTLASDFFKLGKMKSVYIGAAIMFVLILIVFASLVVVNHVADAPEEGATSIFGNNLLFDFATTASIELMITIIIGIFIGKDFSNGTIRVAVAKGINRLSVYFSKVVVIATLIFGYMAGSLLLCGIFTAIIGYDGAFTGLMFARLMRTFALAFVALMASASIYIMIAFLTRAPGAALGASLGAYLLISFVVEILRLVGVIANNGLSEAVEYFPLQQLSVCASDQAMAVGEAMRLLFMPLAYTLISSFIGIITFLKRDIK